MLTLLRNSADYSLFVIPIINHSGKFFKQKFVNYFLIRAGAEAPARKLFYSAAASSAAFFFFVSFSKATFPTLTFTALTERPVIDSTALITFA